MPIKNIEITGIKKLIIFIDDIDRLDKSEVMAVIKLIRNSANFFNTIFVVSYDKEYLTNAITSISDQGEIFLEKIFQVELNPPSFDKDILKKELINKIVEFSIRRNCL